MFFRQLQRNLSFCSRGGLFVDSSSLQRLPIDLAVFSTFKYLVVADDQLIDQFHQLQGLEPLEFQLGKSLASSELFILLSKLKLPQIVVMRDSIGAFAPIRISTDATNIQPEKDAFSLEGQLLFRHSAGISYLLYKALAGSRFTGISTHHFTNDTLLECLKKIHECDTGDMLEIRNICDAHLDPKALIQYAETENEELWDFGLNNGLTTDTLAKLDSFLAKSQEPWAEQLKLNLPNISETTLNNWQVSRLIQEHAKQAKSRRSLASPAYIAELTGSPVNEIEKDQIIDPVAYHQITELPTIDDVRSIVTGENPAVGDFAMTEKEVVRWFRKNWGKPVQVKPEEEEIDSQEEQDEAVQEPLKIPIAAERSELIEYKVKRIIKQFCIAEEKRFLRWKE